MSAYYHSNCTSAVRTVEGGVAIDSVGPCVTVDVIGEVHLSPKRARRMAKAIKRSAKHAEMRAAELNRRAR